MSATYRAVEVTRPGLLQLTQRPLKEPAAGQPISGAHSDGGYAEIMMAFPNGLVAIPDGLSSVDAAPFPSGFDDGRT